MKIATGVVAGTAMLSMAGYGSAGAAVTPSSPIKHVVVLLEENHSFDNVLGKYCTEVAAGQIVRAGKDERCDGATTGREINGQKVPLVPAPDLVPQSDHLVASQTLDIDGGKMNGFDQRAPCTVNAANCYNQYDALSGPCTLGSCIPNLVALANQYTVSDKTFELYSSPSWGGHLYFATANQDGFLGNNPKNSTSGPQALTHGGGWGCDSGATTPWGPLQTLVPSCIPDASGSLGPNWAGYTGPHAAYVPTIFDELDAKGLPWKIYGGQAKSDGSGNFQPSGYQWSVCPSFAECIYGPDHANLVPETQFETDAAAGSLPAFSLLTPTTADSEHNRFSMSEGDDYIGHVISSIQHSPDWSSTAVFITYDDCGCFYDHVNPLQYNPQWGVRVPMVIVSPYARAGATYRQPTTFAGILAFVEHTYGLAPLNSADGTARDYAGAFCMPTNTMCTPAGLTPTTMVNQYVPPPTPAQVAAQTAAAQEDS